LVRAHSPTTVSLLPAIRQWRTLGHDFHRDIDLYERNTSSDAGTTLTKSCNGCSWLVRRWAACCRGAAAYGSFAGRFQGQLKEEIYASSVTGTLCRYRHHAPGLCEKPAGRSHPGSAQSSEQAGQGVAGTNENDFNNLVESIKDVGKIKAGKLPLGRRFEFSPVEYQSHTGETPQIPSRICTDDWGECFDPPELGAGPAQTGRPRQGTPSSRIEKPQSRCGCPESITRCPLTLTLNAVELEACRAGFPTCRFSIGRLESLPYK
jgi:hypothetical protein